MYTYIASCLVSGHLTMVFYSYLGYSMGTSNMFKAIIPEFGDLGDLMVILLMPTGALIGTIICLFIVNSLSN